MKTIPRARRSASAPLRLAVALGILATLPAVSHAAANASAEAPSGPHMVGQLSGDVERGRELFNGRAICSTCHGIDGYRSRLPLMTPNAERAIAGLRPPPANLRDRQGLTLKTEDQRFEIIRKGHINTRMEPMPDSVLTDQDIADLLAYLAVLRGER